MKHPNSDHLLECLIFLSRYHGNAVTADALLAGLPVVDGRLTPELFSRAATRCGLSSKILQRPLSHISDSLLPAVLILHDEQACLLMGWSESGDALIVDPLKSSESVTMSREELAQRYTGRALLARPQFEFDERAPILQSHKTSHWFWSVFFENKRLYRDVLVAAFLINVFALALPIFTMNVYDRVVPNYALETLWMLAIGVVLVLLGDLSLKTLRGYFIDLAGRRVDTKLTATIMERVLGMRLEHKPQSVGSFASNLRSFEVIREFMSSAALATLIDFPFVLVFMAVLMWISPWLVLPLLVGMVIIIVYAFSTQAKMEELTETTYRTSAMRNAVLVEGLSGLETVKALAAEGNIQRRWERSAEFLARVGSQLKLLSSSNGNVAAWTQQAVSVAIIVTGVYLIAAGELTMGGLIAASMLTGRAMAPLGQVAALTTQLHHVKTAFESLDGIMAQEIERPEGSHFLSRKNFTGQIEFRNVSFAYPGSEVKALNNVSFIIKPGESVAVLGRIGSGKTTLHKLVMGLYQPTEGAVLIDGIDVRQLDPAELRRHIGYVPQDVTLFYGSLRENIVMGNPQATDDDVIKAAEFANLNDFVNAHPQGFDMPVGERGEFLSGGQRKSVSLARSLVNDPTMLLLDEPTGSMDQSTESWVREQLSGYASDKTLLMVTHRTTLLPLVDRILVVDKGQIVADGQRDKVVEALRQGRIGKVV
ncbi:MAG: type I secretion system permease/ATPase [Candidatus Pelagadaptatus aseana]|uniref:type I secretion system permease/ATPase n=1 Tax=Candidatus Pelagadaptatus aseana TaxID=3120508 RepID=UPI0039B1405D